MPTNIQQQLKALGQALVQHNKTLSLAESCTGGLLAAYCTSLSGSSAWFERGFVTYSNAAKSELLKVPAALIEAHGAVSQPVVIAMAEGVLEHSPSHIAASISGIAGPNGGSADKPVGNVCFGFALKGVGSISYSKHFDGDREQIREAACEFALAQLIKISSDNALPTSKAPCS